MARLRKEIDDFETHAVPAKPVLVSAAPEDHRGWEKLWRGIAEAGAIMLVATVVVLIALVRTIRWLLRRRRAAAG